MDDIKRKPTTPPPTVAPQPLPTPPTPPIDPVLPVTLEPVQELPPTTPPKKSRKRLIIWSIVGFVVALLVAFGGLFLWYSAQLQPVDSTNTDKKLVTIESGTTPNEIATLLEDEGLIRSDTAFMWYTRAQGVQNTLQAGTYRLSPSESTPQIVTHITSGKVDTFNLTFLPGATLADHREVLLGAGFSESEVDMALNKSYYDLPLFQDKPASADLEGYIYGETYTFSTDTTVEAILERTFSEYYSVLKEHNLIAKYKEQGLNLFEGITLASIVQREASPAGDDMAQIAQVFYSRLALGMPLGSDVTYQYIADKTGVARDPSLDSPYNTRRYAGLPPGPIASPGEKALIAVGNPAEGDYLYFLSGDDDVTYFATTLAGHEANITNHCQVKCKIL